MYTANQTYNFNASHGSSNNSNSQSSAPYTSYHTDNSSGYVAGGMMPLQPDMLSAYQAQQYGGYQQSIHTPTGMEGSYHGSNNGGNMYPNMASYPNSSWTTTHTGNTGAFNPYTANDSNTKVEGKKYRHNPYASSEQSTPPASPLMSASHSSHFGDNSFAAMSDSAAPVYDPSVLAGDSHQMPHGSGPMNQMPVSNNLEDQFNACVGMIAQTACTARGRTLLLNVIRMQHLDKIQIIFEELCQNFSVVISDPQGCHVLRFIVEYLQESQIDALCSIMTPELAYDMCTLSQHSRRVLQCLVEHHKTIHLQPLMELICSNHQAIAIAKTQQGCIAIMRILENVVQPLKDLVFQAIAPAFAELSVDQFGNYTVQTAIQIMDRVTLSATFEQVVHGHFVHVSCNKFGSNVMEKVVRGSTPSLQRMLLSELCYEPMNLHKLINDGFGNFVIQALVEITAGTPEGRRLCETIRPLLQSSPYGHKIEAKLRSKRLLTNATNDSNIRSNSTHGSSSSGSTCGDHN